MIGAGDQGLDLSPLAAEEVQRIAHRAGEGVEARRSGRPGLADLAGAERSRVACGFAASVAGRKPRPQPEPDRGYAPGPRGPSRQGRAVTSGPRSPDRPARPIRIAATRRVRGFPGRDDLRRAVRVQPCRSRLDRGSGRACGAGRLKFGPTAQPPAIRPITTEPASQRRRQGAALLADVHIDLLAGVELHLRIGANRKITGSTRRSTCSCRWFESSIFGVT